MDLKKIILFIPFIFMFLKCYSQPVNVETLYGKNYKLINGATDYLSANSLISLDSVRRSVIQKKFTKLGNEGVIFLGYNPHYYWYRFSFSNKSNRAKNLELLLDMFYQRINTEGKINFHFYYSGKNNRFNKQEYLVIYRIIMELTNNIIKHSHATEASIQLVYHENQIKEI